MFVTCAAVPAMAVTHEVSISGFTFTPQDLTIDVGDSVHWSWSTPHNHNVESGVGGSHDGNFRSGNAATTGNYTVVFDEAFLLANPMPGDEYPYYCILHFGGGMIGSVTVNPPPVPSVSRWGLFSLMTVPVAVGAFLCRRRVAHR